MYQFDLWDPQLKMIPLVNYLPDSYFMVYEVRLGGCGGLATSFKGHEYNIEGAQIGLPLGRCFVQFNAFRLK